MVVTLVLDWTSTLLLFRPVLVVRNAFGFGQSKVCVVADGFGSIVVDGCCVVASEPVNALGTSLVETRDCVWRISFLCC